MNQDTSFCLSQLLGQCFRSSLKKACNIPLQSLTSILNIVFRGGNFFGRKIGVKLSLWVLSPVLFLWFSWPKSKTTCYLIDITGGENHFQQTQPMACAHNKNWPAVALPYSGAAFSLGLEEEQASCLPSESRQGMCAQREEALLAMLGLCLPAPPFKRQTLLSVADMLSMLARHVGDILLCWTIFWLFVSCQWDLLPTHNPACM